MLAAMSSALPSTSSQATAVSRDRGDACPGTLRLHAADDGALARVRIPGGVLNVVQAEALADAARRLGDGDLHLTSRGNVQLRGLRDGCGGELAGLLDAAGLLPSPGHERVRNVAASPLSGLDGRGLRDVRPWLSALDAALCASDRARELSGRFLFALDDGRGDVTGLGADVTVQAAGDDDALVSLGSVDDAWRVASGEAPRVALLAAEAFLDVARESGARVWRVDELAVPARVLTRVLDRRLSEAGVAHVKERTHTTHTDGPPPGLVGDALCAHVPLGRLTAPQWRELTRVAAPTRDAELRLTPWRGVVVPVRGLGTTDTADALGRLSAAGLVTDAASPWPRVGACIGRPGCGKSHADVRADAADGLSAAGRSPLPLYWSGCERRCGHPRGERIDLVAVPEGGYRLTAGAPGGPTRTTVLTDPSHLATALAAITP
ncbi:precorrin-3B synthase [Streptomyces sp. NPDC001705]